MSPEVGHLGYKRPSSYTSGGDEPEQGGLKWLLEMAEHVAGELGLLCTRDLQDLAAIVYVNILNDLPPADLRRLLVTQLRHQILIWAWEEGQEGGRLPLAPRRMSLTHPEGRTK